MQILIAYYSFEGNCRRLAECMANAVDAEVEELSPVEESIPRSPVGKYFYGGKASLFRETTLLKPLSRHPRNYDLVVVGGPVWFLNITPAVRTFLCETEWTGLRAAVFAMHRGGKGKAIATMRSLVERGGGTVSGAAEFVDLRRGSAEQTIAGARDWLRRLVQPVASVTDR